jgi:hypothetical protein
MDRKTILITVVSVSVVLLAVATVTASTRKANTPLYTLRMEQASSKMNFLPTEMTEFTYTTEEGYTMNHGAGCCNGAYINAETEYQTCRETCGSTCDTCETCPNTCWSTCPNTCWSTCPNTCWSTCPETCPSTCSNTCWSTCNPTCDEYTCSGYKCP